MTMVTVVARETFPYDGIPRRAGEAFEATREDARLLVMTGKALRQDTETDPIDVSDDVADGEPSAPPKSRRYRSRRKDVVPEA